eukprot:1147342-Pelagomonas_calceolata.AAC.8
MTSHGSGCVPAVMKHVTDDEFSVKAAHGAVPPPIPHVLRLQEGYRKKEGLQSKRLTASLLIKKQ